MKWTDAPMPGWYYAAATAALAFALVAPENRGPVLRPALLATVTFVGLLTATCLALYLSWTHRGPKAWSAMVNRTPAGR